MCFRDHLHATVRTMVILVCGLTFYESRAQPQTQPLSSNDEDQGPVRLQRVEIDTDRDGLSDDEDSCPQLSYQPQFDFNQCTPMDLDPGNDTAPECKARERVAAMLFDSGVFLTHISFAVVKDGELHFADAFEYTGQGQFEHNPQGVYRLYRIGSTTKPIVAVAAKVMENNGELSLRDFVDAEDATQKTVNGERRLRQLLSHDGAFKLDIGAIHLYCYDGDLLEFWRDPDDLISPHYDSEVYGNYQGGYEYSAFNFSLGGAYMMNRADESFEQVLQSRVFDPAGMCTATLDGSRAVNTPIGNGTGVSQSATMHVGPYINLVAPTDPRCIDNYYSSDDLYGDDYDWQYYRLDEANANARDPAGGVIASVIDMAQFAAALLECYHTPNGLISPEDIRDLWTATADLGCEPNCPYQRYYGIGFFTNSITGVNITEVEHGGARPGYATAFVIRPEENLAVTILTNADVSTVALSDLAKVILDDFEDQ